MSDRANYCYNGPVLDFFNGNEIEPSYKATTNAVSAKKALNNLAYRKRQEVGYPVKLSIDYLREVDDDYTYNAVDLTEKEEQEAEDDARAKEYYQPKLFDDSSYARKYSRFDA